MMGGQDVVDEAGAPAGGFVTRSAGGHTIAAPAGAKMDCVGCLPKVPSVPAGEPLPGQPLSGRSDFALLVGETGGDGGGNASWALDHRGAVHHWGPGGSGHVALNRRIKGSADWDPPPLNVGAMAKLSVSVDGAVVGDLCTATLTSLGDRLGAVNCHVVDADRVSVVLAAGEAMDVPMGQARAVVSNFAW